MNLTHRAKLHSLEHVRIGSEADSLHSTNFMSALSPITSRSFAFSVGDSRSGKKGAWNAARRLEFHKSRNLILTRGGLPGVRAKHTIVGSKHLPK